MALETEFDESWVKGEVKLVAVEVTDDPKTGRCFFRVLA
jgi:hypothetical protein